MAWKTSAEVDLGEWLKKPGLASVSAYARRVDSGFLSDGERGGVAANREGARALLDAGRFGKLAARYDHESRPELREFAQVRATDVLGLQWRRDAARSGVAAEFEERQTERVADYINRNATAAVRYWIQPAAAWKATLEHQRMLSSGGGQSALALEWRALSMLSLEARGATGDLGNSLRGGATFTMNGRQLYVREERGGATGMQNSTLFGVQAPLGPMSRAYSEYQVQHDAAGDRAMSVSGLEQGWKSAAGVAAQLAGEHGSRSGETGEHTTVSGTLAYKGALPVSGSTRGEVRNLEGRADGRQLLTATRLELALPSGFSMLTDMRLSTLAAAEITRAHTAPCCSKP